MRSRSRLSRLPFRLRPFFSWFSTEEHQVESEERQAVHRPRLGEARFWELDKLRGGKTKDERYGILKGWNNNQNTEKNEETLDKCVWSKSKQK